MINIIKKALLQLIEDIDVGNTNISEEEEIEVLKLIQKLRKDEGMSKYSAYTYLNISRATFDNYVAEGKIPQGQKVIGFKELRWYKKDLDNFINQCKNDYQKEI
jgi:predicted DNA-binding transcriptional regulator AlpA